MYTYNVVSQDKTVNHFMMTKIQVRISEETHESLKRIALEWGYIYAGKGSLSQLLEAISSGEVRLAPSTRTKRD